MKNQISDNKLGVRLKLLRQSAGYTQEQLAENIGVSRTAVAKWENGCAEPTLQNIVRISEIFAVSTDFLLGIKTDRNNPMPDMSVEALYALKIFINEINKSANQ